MAGSRLAPGLISQEGFDRARHLAQQLPASALGVLEVHLSPARGMPDLSIRLQNRAQAEASAALLSPPHFRRFLTRWLAALEAGDDRMPSLWLEFDLDVPSGRRLVPILCAKLCPAAEPAWLLDSVLPSLVGAPLEAAQIERIRCCLAEIPPGAHLLYVFHLLPRGGDLRLELFGVRPEEMAAYLARVGAPIAPAEVSRAAALLSGAERTHLSFDLGAQGLRSRIGIEGSFATLPHRDPRWEELLRRLGENGLCSPRQRAALLAWHGAESFWTAPGRWPRRGAIDAFCLRYLSHLKVVCQPGRPLAAKAYLAFKVHRRSPAAPEADSSSARAVARRT